MPRKPTGKITERDVKVRQKNGSIYVYHQQLQYNQEKKQMERISNHLMGKIPAGETEMVPTRHKRPKATAPQEPAETDVVPTRQNRLEAAAPVEPQQLTGIETADGECIIMDPEAQRISSVMQMLLDWTGKESGIDKDVMASMQMGDAQKAISVARFVAATNGATTPHIDEWQKLHPPVYESGMSSRICYALYQALGTDESTRTRYFEARAKRLGENPVLAFDTTTISTDAKGIDVARLGFNKDGDGKITFKIMTFYAALDREPISFSIQPGNIPDVSAVTNAVTEMKSFGLEKPRLVLDNGFWSEANLGELCRNSIDFIIPGRASVSWLKPIIDKAQSDIMRPDHLVLSPDETPTYVSAQTATHTFTYQRKYANNKLKKEAGSKETFECQLNLHVCFNPDKKQKEDTDFMKRLKEAAAKALESGTTAVCTASEARDIARFCIVKTRGKKITSIEWNSAAIQDACKYHGYFVLVANRERNAQEALWEYRKRETVEEFYRLQKQDADGKRPREWTTLHVLGRLTTQFIALGYEDYIRRRIREVKSSLEEQRTAARLDPDNNRMSELDLSLLKWLNKTSFPEMLEYFDAYTDVVFHVNGKKFRMPAIITKRDRRLFELLGVKVAS